MFALLARRLHLSRPSRVSTEDDGRQSPADERETGWHESSWTIARGVQVIELPASAAAELFPDTQPAFYDPADGPTRIAA